MQTCCSSCWLVGLSLAGCQFDSRTAPPDFSSVCSPTDLHTLRCLPHSRPHSHSSAVLTRPEMKSCLSLSVNPTPTLSLAHTHTHYICLSIFVKTHVLMLLVERLI